jgi:predicted nucleotidyltransferase
MRNEKLEIRKGVTFAPEADWSLFDHLRMKQELKGMLNRDVDLFNKKAVEYSPNPLRRQEILKSAQVVHVHK